MQKELILRFLNHLRVSYDNNQAERYQNDEATTENFGNFLKYRRSGSFLQNSGIHILN